MVVFFLLFLPCLISFLFSSSLLLLLFFWHCAVCLALRMRHMKSGVKEVGAGSFTAVPPEVYSSRLMRCTGIDSMATFLPFFFFPFFSFSAGIKAPRRSLLFHPIFALGGLLTTIKYITFEQSPIINSSLLTK